MVQYCNFFSKVSLKASWCVKHTKKFKMLPLLEQYHPSSLSANHLWRQSDKVAEITWVRQDGVVAPGSSPGKSCHIEHTGLQNVWLFSLYWQSRHGTLELSLWLLFLIYFTDLFLTNGDVHACYTIPQRLLQQLSLLKTIPSYTQNLYDVIIGINLLFKIMW